MPINNSIRLVSFLLSLIGFTVAFLFQNFDIISLSYNRNGFYEFSPNVHSEFNFVINKLWRYILNNISSLITIHLLFKDDRFSRAIAFIQLLILIVFFPLFCYFAFSDFMILKQLYQKLNIVLINPIVPFILGVSYYFKSRKTTDK
jgi:hypothetical protein